MNSKILTLVLVIFVITPALNAAILLTEPFNATGTMPLTGWTSISGTGSHISITSSNGLEMGTSDRDYDRQFTAQSGDVFYGFDLSVPVGLPSGSEYFTGFGDGTGFDSRVFITKETGDNFSLGLSIGGSSAATSTSAFSLGSSYYRVVVRYNATTDSTALWIGTYSELAPSISITGTDASTSTNEIFLRQADEYDNLASPIWYVRNLTVATSFAEVAPIPEPSTYVLIGLGLAGLIALRRFKRAA